jgi:hypothetical protein
MLAYSSALRSYISFCTAHHFSIAPTPDTLSFFTVYMCHHIKPSSVSAYLSGVCIQLEPFYPDVRSRRLHPLVTRTLRGCKKMRAVGTTRKRPLLHSELVSLCDAYRPSFDHDDKLFLSLLLVGFHALARSVSWCGRIALPCAITER